MQKVPLIFWRNQQIVRKTKNFLDTTTKKGYGCLCAAVPFFSLQLVVRLAGEGEAYSSVP